MFLKRIEKLETGRSVEITECDVVSYDRVKDRIFLRATKNGREIICSETGEGVDFYILNDTGRTVDSVKW